MKVLVTGANGFIGKNLLAHLRERNIEVVPFTREKSFNDLAVALSSVDFVFHLAGVNRPTNESEFAIGNTELTQKLCELINKSGKSIPVLYASSVQTEVDNLYGVSKLGAENSLITLQKGTMSPVYLCRLPNVFGKWSRPNYNSVVATFCYNIANDQEIKINNAESLVHLVYIDDVIKGFVRILEEKPSGVVWPKISPEYSATVGELAYRIKLFKNSRDTLTMEAVGTGFTRALYSTYLSFLTPTQFAYPLVTHVDPRGRFVEILKTKDTGQFSFFTAHPSITRGGHYHHSKNEKFLVLQGRAKFCFRHVITHEIYEVFATGDKSEVIESVPGWSHDITNVGSNELIVMVWANEVFDPQNPDTITHRV